MNRKASHTTRLLSLKRDLKILADALSVPVFPPIIDSRVDRGFLKIHRAHFQRIPVPFFPPRFMFLPLLLGRVPVSVQSAIKEYRALDLPSIFHLVEEIGDNWEDKRSIERRRLHYTTDLFRVEAMTLADILSSGEVTWMNDSLIIFSRVRAR